MDKPISLAEPPETLVEAIRYFADPDVCLTFMAGLRWPDGVVKCPTCGGDAVSFLSTRRIWKCREEHERRQFSIKVGTVFEDSPIPLEKWLPAMWMLVNCKNGISSYEMGRALGVMQRTAWFMNHRLRLVIQTGTFAKMSAEVEVDETYIGGKARFMHPWKRAAKIRGTGGMDKSAVMGLLERHGPDGHSRVRVKHVPNVRRKTLAPEVRQHVEPGASVYSDALKSYEGLAQDYTHEVIDHAEAYVKGRVHTNGMENFWSLLKRGIKGTYVSVEPFHLFRYPGRAGLSVQQPEGHRLAPLRPGHALYPGQATHLQGAHRGWARIGYDVRAEANGVSLCLPVGMRDLKPDSKRTTGGLGVLLGQQELECIGEMLHCHEVNAIVGHCHHILAIRTDEWPRVPVLRGNADDRLAAPTLEPDSHQIRKANDEAILYCHEPTSTGE